MTPIVELIAKNIKRLREWKKFSQKVVCVSAGLPQGQYPPSAYEVPYTYIGQKVQVKQREKRKGSTTFCVESSIFHISKNFNKTLVFTTILRFYLFFIFFFPKK
jgi:hypothetical protein